jgi:hypothetical protein
MAVEIKIMFEKAYKWSTPTPEGFYQMTMTKIDGNKSHHQTMGLSTGMIEQDNPMQVLSVLQSSLAHLFVQDLTEEQTLMEAFPTIERDEEEKKRALESLKELQDQVNQSKKDNHHD